MKLSLIRLTLPLISVALTACSSMAPQASTQAPASLQAPEGQSFAFELAAKGVQIYSCKANAKDNTRFEWTFVAPEAELFRGPTMSKVGTHGAGPFWAMNDGGRVVGEVAAKADSPDTNAIPWLLLKVKSNAGTGEFSAIKSIQRVATFEGKAPATGCDATSVGKELRVPYTATYNFFK